MSDNFVPPREVDDAPPRKRRKASEDKTSATLETNVATIKANEEPPTAPTIQSDLEPGLERHILKSFNSQLDLWGECGQRMESVDWSKTTLGPRSTWPSSYERGLNVVLSNRFPTVYYLGPDFNFIYNDGYIPIAGQRHPACFGKPAREVNIM